jgi:hypothetical protein
MKDNLIERLKEASEANESKEVAKLLKETYLRLVAYETIIQSYRSLLNGDYT